MVNCCQEQCVLLALEVDPGHQGIEHPLIHLVGASIRFDPVALAPPSTVTPDFGLSAQVHAFSPD